MQRAFPRILVVHMLLAAALCSLHHWVALAVTRGDYSPFGASRQVSAMTLDETLAYAPPALRFMETGKIPAEVDSYELRNASAGIPFLPPAILGGIGRLLGSLEWSFIAADVLFPAIALWLLYWAADGVVESPLSRLLIAWATLLISFGPRNFLWMGYDALLSGPDFTRTPQPEISFPLLLAGALLAARAIRSSTNWPAVLAGAVSALIVYSYYFYAVGWGMTLGMLLALAVLWRNWAAAKQTAIMLAVMVAGSVPYVLATVRGKVEGGQTNLLARMGSYTHSPRQIPLLLFAAGLLAIRRLGRSWLEGKPYQARIAVLTLLLLAGVAGLNFQILSGYDAQHTHFANRLILPMGFFLGGCWFFSVLEAHAIRYRRAVMAGLIGLLLSVAARQTLAGVRIAAIQRASTPEIELLRWVWANLPPDRVIGTLDPQLILMLPAMALEYTYVPSELRSLAPSREITERYYEIASLSGLSKAEVLTNALAPGHLGHSRLAVVVYNTGTAQSFAEDYAQYRETDSGRRLDYLILPAAVGIPDHVAKRFPSAKAIYGNRAYELVALKPDSR